MKRGGVIPLPGFNKIPKENLRMGDRKHFWIYSRKLAIYLQIKNCILQGINEHSEDPKRKVFVFNNSDRVKQLVNDYQRDTNFQRYFDIIAKGDVTAGAKRKEDIQTNTR